MSFVVLRRPGAADQSFAVDPEEFWTPNLRPVAPVRTIDFPGLDLLTGCPESDWVSRIRLLGVQHQLLWYGDAVAIGTALSGARRVRSIDEPHLAPWLQSWAACESAPALFPQVDRRCDSFSQWWTRATKRLGSVEELLAVG